MALGCQAAAIQSTRWRRRAAGRRTTSVSVAGSVAASVCTTIVGADWTVSVSAGLLSLNSGAFLRRGTRRSAAAERTERRARGERRAHLPRLGGSKQTPQRTRQAVMAPLKILAAAHAVTLTVTPEFSGRFTYSDTVWKAQGTCEWGGGRTGRKGVTRLESGSLLALAAATVGAAKDRCPPTCTAAPPVSDDACAAVSGLAVTAKSTCVHARPAAHGWRHRLRRRRTEALGERAGTHTRARTRVPEAVRSATAAAELATRRTTTLLALLARSSTAVVICVRADEVISR